MRREKVLLLFGGISPEHDVSLRTASFVLENIDTELFEVLPVGITRRGEWYYFPSSPRKLVQKLLSGDWELETEKSAALLSPVRGHGLLLFSKGGAKIFGIDCVFPALHGENGEDGAIQGLCRLAGIPCVGSGLSASAVCMDKTLSKLCAIDEDIPATPFLVLMKSDAEKDPEKAAERIEAAFPYPVFVKPSSTGSSVGISKAKNRKNLLRALSEAAKYSEKILVEKAMDGREIEVAVLGNLDAQVSVCGEIIPGAEFYTYDDKYIDDAATLRVPAELPPGKAEEIRGYAKKLFLNIGCSGLARVDFFLERETDGVFFNEINSLPGFTSISMYPRLMEASGVPAKELVTRLITSALEVTHG